jgi:hypothetical protein
VQLLHTHCNKILTLNPGIANLLKTSTLSFMSSHVPLEQLREYSNRSGNHCTNQMPGQRMCATLSR